MQSNIGVCGFPTMIGSLFADVLTADTILPVPIKSYN